MMEVLISLEKRIVIFSDSLVSSKPTLTLYNFPSLRVELSMINLYRTIFSAYYLPLLEISLSIQNTLDEIRQDVHIEIL